ncbi:MAG: 3-oxoacyl-ACP reductase [Deltaproteobacteria bacterium]|nr:3-oxoacyl-ACP reductase [Deltaproteobacteria bacterium]
MSDFLLDLAQNKVARELVKRLGLPLPLPERLRRADRPWGARELERRLALVVPAPGAALLPAIAATLARDGAEVRLLAADPGPFARPAEAWSRPVEAWGALPAELPRLDLVLVDASGITGPADLAALHRQVGPALPALGRSARVVLLGRPEVEAGTPAAAAACHALDGFVRSVAKEIGRRGGTATRLLIARAAEARLPAVLRWVLSARSAWMTGQTITIDGVVTGEAPEVPDAPMVKPLSGRTALVTGAARGIGAAMVRRFAEEGARVIAVDRPGDDGPLAAVARSTGATPVALDVTRPDAAEVMRDAAGGALDVLVHNAGVTRDKTLARMSPEQWDQALAVNLEAVVGTTDALVARGLADHGRIVCLSSIAGIAGNVGQTNYAAAKAGVIGYVRALAPLVAARGITVNALAPGFVETRLTRAIPPMQREVARRLAALGQGGVPEDVAELALFLASPGAVGVTGQTLRICGGNFVGA